MYTLNSLAEIIAQIITFAYSDYYQGDGASELPEDIQWHISYIVACFLAQHTPKGDDGCCTETAMDVMQVCTYMTYNERLELAKVVVEKFQ